MVDHLGYLMALTIMEEQLYLVLLCYLMKQFQVLIGCFSLLCRDKAMAAAMECVLPNTCHRIYIWHMYQNACLSPRSCVLPNYRWAETI